MTPEELGHQDENGNMPLHLAIQNKYFQFAKDLIKKMSPDDIHTRNKDFKTPLHLLFEIRAQSLKEADSPNKTKTISDTRDLLNRIGFKARLNEQEFAHVKERYGEVKDDYYRIPEPKAAKTTNTDTD